MGNIRQYSAHTVYIDNISYWPIHSYNHSISHSTLHTFDLDKQNASRPQSQRRSSLQCSVQTLIQQLGSSDQTRNQTRRARSKRSPGHARARVEESRCTYSRITVETENNDSKNQKEDCSEQR